MSLKMLFKMLSKIISQIISNQSKLFLSFEKKHWADFNEIFMEDRICLAEQKTSQVPAD